MALQINNPKESILREMEIGRDRIEHAIKSASDDIAILDMGVVFALKFSVLSEQRELKTCFWLSSQSKGALDNIRPDAFRMTTPLYEWVISGDDSYAVWRARILTNMFGTKC